jgi:hypothetical protein
VDKQIGFEKWLEPLLECGGNQLSATGMNAIYADSVGTLITSEETVVKRLGKKGCQGHWKGVRGAVVGGTIIITISPSFEAQHINKEEQ